MDDYNLKTILLFSIIPITSMKTGDLESKN